MKKSNMKCDGPFCQWPAQPSHNIQPERRIDWLHLILSAIAVLSFLAMAVVALVIVGS